jgi:hypothetical protein
VSGAGCRLFENKHKTDVSEMLVLISWEIRFLMLVLR